MHFILNKMITVTAMVIFCSFTSLFSMDSLASEKVMHMHFHLDESYLPLTNIEIDGKKQEFIIDTGSNTALHLSKELMAKIAFLSMACYLKTSVVCH